MTDNEIVKVLECCKGKKKHCDCCPCMQDGTCFEVEGAALDLILRQQEKIEALIAGQETLQRYIKTAKTEAIKEFADKLEADIGDEDFYVQDKLLLMSMIDNLVKEMGCGE